MIATVVMMGSAMAQTPAATATTAAKAETAKVAAKAETKVAEVKADAKAAAPHLRRPALSAAPRNTAALPVRCRRHRRRRADLAAGGLRRRLTMIPG